MSDSTRLLVIAVGMVLAFVVFALAALGFFDIGPLSTRRARSAASSPEAFLRTLRLTHQMVFVSKALMLAGVVGILYFALIGPNISGLAVYLNVFAGGGLLYERGYRMGKQVIEQGYRDDPA